MSWQFRKQSQMAESVLEAEFITWSEASREMKWLLQLQQGIHGSQKDSSPLLIISNNQGALTLITMGIMKA